MSDLDVEIIKAHLEQSSIIAQLYELYTYEMTDLADFDIHDNGYYGYEDLPLYWKDPNKHPYLVWVNKKLAGFVLIQKGSPINKEPDVWDVSEFFIMRKFLKKGIGQVVAHQLWEQYRGIWQVRVWDNNIIAHAFWDNAIQKFVNDRIIPIKMAYQGHEGLLVYRFKS